MSELVFKVTIPLTQDAAALLTEREILQALQTCLEKAFLSPQVELWKQ